jgi:SAM-dependent methyltransferase
MGDTVCCAVDLERPFDARVAARDLADFRRHGLPAPSRLLRDMLVRAGLKDRSVLDIGGGVGAIHHDLLRAGARSITDVDGSSAYIDAARTEAVRQGHAEQIAYRHGDFTRLVDEIEPADVVILIAVLCCYPDMPTLVRLSAARAGQFYGLVYPRSTWWMRAAAAAYGILRPGLNSGPGHVHDEQAVDRAVRLSGLMPRANASTWYWRVVLYERPASPRQPVGRSRSSGPT